MTRHASPHILQESCSCVIQKSQAAAAPIDAVQGAQMQEQHAEKMNMTNLMCEEMVAAAKEKEAAVLAKTAEIERQLQQQGSRGSGLLARVSSGMRGVGCLASHSPWPLV